MLSTQVTRIIASAAITFAVVVPFVPPALATTKMQSNRGGSNIPLQPAFVRHTFSVIIPACF